MIRLRYSIAALGLLALTAPCVPAKDRAGPGTAVWHYVGRVSLNFTNGTGTVYGYFTAIEGVGAGPALFKGTPSESTAYFTFRADIRFMPLAGNGDFGSQFAVFPTFVLPGDFKVYYSANPSANWTRPDTFSSGQLIATLARKAEQFATIGPVATNTATARLTSGDEFTFGNRAYDSREIVRAVTNVTTGNAIPLSGSTPVTPSFAFAGYGLAAK